MIADKQEGGMDDAGLFGKQRPIFGGMQWIFFGHGLLQ